MKWINEHVRENIINFGEKQNVPEAEQQVQASTRKAALMILQELKTFAGIAANAFTFHIPLIWASNKFRCYNMAWCHMIKWLSSDEITLIPKKKAIYYSWLIIEINSEMCSCGNWRHVINMVYKRDIYTVICQSFWAECGNCLQANEGHSKCYRLRLFSAESGIY